jgi:hypothetical protein
MAATGAAVSIKLDAREMAQLSAHLKRVAPAWRAAMNKEISKSGKPVVAAMRASVTGVATRVDSAGGAGQVSSYKSERLKDGGPRAGRGAYLDRAQTSLGKRATATTLQSEKGAKRLARAVGGSGLRASVARSLRLVNRAAGDSYTLTIQAEGSRMPAGQQNLPRAMNTGRWRHPVMGNMNAWVTQMVSPPDWFMKEAEKAKPKLVADVKRVMDEYAAKAAHFK